MAHFEIGEHVMLNGKEYKIIGTVKRSYKLERLDNGKHYKATANMMGKIQHQNARGIGVGRRKRAELPEFFHMKKRVEFNKLFDPVSAKARMPKTYEEHMECFSVLSNELSPENLHCDGEISRSAAMKKYRALMAEWKEVEKHLGSKISEDEVYAYERKKYNW